ncbi:MAG: S24/S26 family peptidase [Deltaproteobacteria bacterium]|nr:S24/S26 family peptidase [Deltaproteobacteria bacterium]
MGWADGHIARLALGETVQFRPRGHSMTGKVNDGELCTVAPLAADHVLKVGDIVLCRVNGSQYLHLIKAIQGERFQIGNNRGGINGWVTRRQIFGRLMAVEA